MKLSAVVCPTQGDRRKALRGGIVERCSIRHQVPLNTGSCVVWPVFPVRNRYAQVMVVGRGCFIASWGFSQNLLLVGRGGGEIKQKSSSPRACRAGCVPPAGFLGQWASAWVMAALWKGQRWRGEGISSPFTQMAGRRRPSASTSNLGELLSCWTWPMAALLFLLRELLIQRRISSLVKSRSWTRICSFRGYKLTACQTLPCCFDELEFTYGSWSSWFLLCCRPTIPYSPYHVHLILCSDLGCRRHLSFISLGLCGQSSSFSYWKAVIPHFTGSMTLERLNFLISILQEKQLRLVA